MTGAPRGKGDGFRVETGTRRISPHADTPLPPPPPVPAHSDAEEAKTERATSFEQQVLDLLHGLQADVSELKRLVDRRAEATQGEIRGLKQMAADGFMHLGHEITRLREHAIRDASEVRASVTALEKRVTHAEEVLRQ